MIIIQVYLTTVMSRSVFILFSGNHFDQVEYKESKEK
jgi:hypothetical protein